MKKGKNKFIAGVILGGLLFGTVGATASSILASNVSYQTNSKSQTGASNIQDALDELYDLARPAYQGFNDSGYSSYSQNLSSLTSNYNLFVKRSLKASDATNPIKTEVCIYKNNELGCFKPEYTEAEKNKLQTFFSEGTCEAGNTPAGEYYECTSGDFSCGVNSDGDVGCISGSLNCEVNADGDFGCDDGGNTE